ncbi:hypothetical protein ACFVH7_22815 [Kitasatospora indigofera]|uniref:hypothetical protein n=1 Tax=Kitasatospora indigofera TaxID=67307 RepID=UPI00362F1963
MAPVLYDRLVKDDEYVQRVRRHRPSVLIPQIAAASARWWGETWWTSPYRKFTPWGLAETARVSLSYGNEHRQEEFSDRDLMGMLAAHQALSDLMVQDVDPEPLFGFMLRLSGEQLVYQQSVFNDLARSAALLKQTTPQKPLKCLVPGWEEELLGCSLEDYVGTAMLLQVAAHSNAGRFDPDWLALSHMRQVTDIIPAQTMTSVLRDHFVTDTAAFRAENAKRRMSKNPMLRRFEYNPLRGRPFLSGFGPGYLAPCSHLIAPKASPLGLFYAGIARYGNPFAEDMGELFEQYVGRQLKLLSNAEVHPEITYRDNRKSVDWIVVFDDLVLLVEVKSTRPTQQLRLGTEDRLSELSRMLKRAYEQVDTSASLISSRNREFLAIPNDRPVLGLIVTMEPFHTANAPFQRQHQPQTDTPTAVVSAQELEHLVAVTDTSANRILLDRAGDAQDSTYSLNAVLTRHRFRRNEILERGWAAYPWSGLEQAATARGAGEPAGG